MVLKKIRIHVMGFKHICVGVDKDKDEEADDQSDQRNLDEALVHPQVREKRTYEQMGKKIPSYIMR